MKKNNFILLVLSILLISKNSQAFRCGSNLVSVQDAMSKVRKLCGEPTLIDTRQKETIQKLSPTDEKRSYVTVDTWVYDLGSNNLLQYLRFENRVLMREWTGDYGGHQKPDRQLCDASSHDIPMEKDQLEIQMKCGAPDEKEHVEDRSSSLLPIGVSEMVYPASMTMVSVDEWTYEFGSEKPETVLRFENGILLRVRKIGK